MFTAVILEADETSDDKDDDDDDDDDDDHDVSSCALAILLEQPSCGMLGFVRIWTARCRQ